MKQQLADAIRMLTRAELIDHSGHGSARVDGKGVDSTSKSRAQMRLDYAVQERGAQACVVLDAKITLSGMLAQFSKGPIISEIAAQLTREFAARLQQRLAAPASGPAASAPPPRAISAGPAESPESISTCRCRGATATSPRLAT